MKKTKLSAFQAHVAKPETPMDKTNRIVKEMGDEEAANKQSKNARLRAARLERDANTQSEATEDARKKPAPKAIKKR